MALLIYVVSDVEDLHDTLHDPVNPEWETDAQGTKYKKSKVKLVNYFSTIKGNDYALFEVMQLKPEEGESANDYATKLRKAGNKCDFSNRNAQKMINCLMISNMKDEELRLKILTRRTHP